ncbi:MAG: haloacid dehalogenase type [Bacilli bacterium]|nr:haloacid dehalogenase type [Bacilli bacterium]
MINTVVFDAYGTLFDVNSVSRVCEKLYPGNGKIISRVWRQKQLEYTWLRSLMGRYIDFEQVNRDALRFTLNQLGKNYTNAIIDTLLDSYLTLPSYPEVESTLKLLTSLRRMILSDGTEKMLQTMVRNAKLELYFDQILSVDRVQVYKPDPRAYEFALTAANVPKEDILFVSSNGWDIAGSKSFGFNVAWVNRVEKPMEELGERPDFIVSNLTELIQIIN